MVGPIVGVGLGVARNVGMRILTAEAGILGKAWWGFKAKREIVAGIRTGLGIGAGLGTFISDTPYDSGNGQIPFKYSSSKFSKKYNRFGKSSRFRRNNHYCKPCNSRRQLSRGRRRSSYRSRY